MSLIMENFVSLHPPSPILVIYFQSFSLFLWEFTSIYLNNILTLQILIFLVLLVI